MSTAAGKIALISSSTNATPIALTTTAAHGYGVGDIIVVGGHATNTAANGTWQCGAGTSGSTINLTTRLDNVNSTGNGAGGATGWVIDLSTASVLSDVSANSVGTDATLSGETMALGVANASAWTWTNLPATKCWAIAVYDTTASNDLICFIDGTYQVYVVTTTSGTYTSVAVTGGMSAGLRAVLPTNGPNAGLVVFSDGTSATISAQNAVGDTSLSVNSQSTVIHRQATADVPYLQAGLPVTPTAGSNLTFNVDSGPAKLFAL